MANFMELNRETAMRLWSKAFGKSATVYDYTGRKIVKGAYNDRNSEFAWNVDHIYPQSKGGATNDSNLIVCHILTNDEKADKFPCFTANKQKFEIVKVQNHYEIKSLSRVQKNQPNKEPNFLDSASGIRFFENLESIQNKPKQVCTICINLIDVEDFRISDFVREIFNNEVLANMPMSVQNDKYPESNEMQMHFVNYEMSYKVDSDLTAEVKSILDKCSILSAYLDYFSKTDVLCSYTILVRMLSYYDINLMLDKSYWADSKDKLPLRKICIDDDVVKYASIDEWKTLELAANMKYFIYDKRFKNLDENLEKEASRRK